MLVVVLAAFLPWISILGISAIGIEGDGQITLGAAVIGLVVLAMTTGLVGSPKTPGRVSQISLLVLAVIAALIGIADMNGAAAIGLYLTFLAGIAWVVGAVWQLASSKQEQAATEDTRITES